MPPRMFITYRVERFGSTITPGRSSKAGCAAPVSEPARTGFLSDYSKLEMREKGKINYASDRFIEFESFMIDPVIILFDRDPENPVFTDKELRDLMEYVVDDLTEQLTKDDGYSVVSEPGPGIARIRLGLAEVNDTIGLLNVSTYTKITGLGLGGVSVEGEIVDSATGEQIAAMIRWGSGSRITRAGFTHTGDARIAIHKWAREAREQLHAAGRLDEARSQGDPEQGEDDHGRDVHDVEPRRARRPGSVSRHPIRLAPMGPARHPPGAPPGAQTD